MKPPSYTALLATLALAALSLVAAPRDAQAGPMIGAVGATASSVAGGGPLVPAYTIDQSGLTQPYVPGVTDFDAYIAAAPMHLPGGPTSWLSQSSDLTPTLWLDLGATQTIDALALWVSDFYPPLGVGIWVSQDGVSWGGVLADTPLVPGTWFEPVSAQVIAFGGVVEARHVRLDFRCPINALGMPAPCGIGEVVFRGAGQAVPAPTTAALVLLPLALLATRQRTRHAPRREPAP